MITPSSRAGIITVFDQLPPFGTYAGGGHAFFEFIIAGAPFPIFVSDARHTIPPQPRNPSTVCPPLPLPCVTDPTLPGFMQEETFDSDAFFTVLIPGQSIPQVFTGVTARTRTELLSNTSSTREYSNELLELEFHGDILGMDFILREDQDANRQSTGRTTIETLGGGLFRIDSFFDVFTELSLDHGRTWNDCIVPAGQVACGRVVLVAEPGTLVLTAAALALLGWRKRWRAGRSPGRDAADALARTARRDRVSQQAGAPS